MAAPGKIGEPCGYLGCERPATQDVVLTRDGPVKTADGQTIEGHRVHLSLTMCACDGCAVLMREEGLIVAPIGLVAPEPKKRRKR